jgi:Bacterial TSP3 repeat
MSRFSLRLIFAMVAILMLAAVPATAGAKSHHKSKHHAAHKADRNKDGLPDSWERQHKLSLKVNQASRDQDRDGAKNVAEFTAGTDPRKADSDNDGVKDGAENVGTIVSFDPATGILVVTAAGGATVSGKVTADTEIKCGCQSGRDGHGDHQGDHHGDATASHNGEGDDDATIPATPATPGTDPATPATPPVACTSASLVKDAVLREAELKLTADGPVWHELKLTTPAPAPVTPTA